MYDKNGGLVSDDENACKIVSVGWLTVELKILAADPTFATHFLSGSFAMGTRTV